MTRSISIYYLEDAKGVIFYVGQSVCPDLRIKQHKNTYGQDIKMELLDEFPQETASFFEIYYIWLFKSWGFNLKNKQIKGIPPTYFTPKIDRPCTIQIIENICLLKNQQMLLESDYEKILIKEKMSQKRRETSECLRRKNENLISQLFVYRQQKISLAHRIEDLKIKKNEMKTAIIELKYEPKIDFLKSMIIPETAIHVGNAEKNIINNYINQRIGLLKQIMNNF